MTLTCAAALLLVMNLNWIKFTAEEFICCSSVTGRIRVSLVFTAKVSSIQFDFICFVTPEQTASRIPNTDKCCHLVDIKHFLSLNDYVFIKSLYIDCLQYILFSFFGFSSGNSMGAQLEVHYFLFYLTCNHMCRTVIPHLLESENDKEQIVKCNPEYYEYVSKHTDLIPRSTLANKYETTQK